MKISENGWFSETVTNYPLMSEPTAFENQVLDAVDLEVDLLILIFTKEKATLKIAKKTRIAPLANHHNRGP